MTDYLSREAASLIRAHTDRYQRKGGGGGGGGGEGRTWGKSSSSIIKTATKTKSKTPTTTTPTTTTPFYINLCYNAPHNPLQALKADYDRLGHISNHNERVYAAMIRSLDRGIGEVVKTLEEVGALNNTLILFTSDNGGAHYVGLSHTNHPFRGWKATFFEVGG